MHRIWLIMPLLYLTALPLSAQPLPGDINGDGTVNDADITRGVEIALGQPPAPSQNELDAADLNGDGLVTVQDLVLLANTIAGGNRPPVADAGASPESGLAGTAIQLDATRSFDLDDDALRYRWRQLHMDRFSTEYVTENEVMLSDSMSATPVFTPEWPGKYRFELEVADAPGLVERDTVDVLVGKDGVRQLDVKGIEFVDVFGELGGPSFDLMPDDPDSMAAVLGRAMDGAVRIGAEWIGIAPAFFYARINPLPEIRPGPNGLSLTVESDYAAIVAAAKAKGLKVIHREQWGDGIFPLRPGERDSLDVLMSTSAAWWDQWFAELENYLLLHAEWAERYGVDVFDPYFWADDTFRPDVYPQYEARWRDVIAAVRDRYSGQISMSLLGFNLDGLTFADALDVVHLMVFANSYPDALADIKNPTLEEIRSHSEAIFDDREARFGGGQIPVYFIFNASSADGQVSGDPIPPAPSDVDNREQVLYYEGFFQALEDEAWVNGLISSVWAWFDELDRPGVFNDKLTEGPRNKPVEEAIKLWFSIY
ncbi:MAG: dockerin type I domain-containing protein [Rhodothermales bacterium]